MVKFKKNTPITKRGKIDFLVTDFLPFPHYIKYCFAFCQQLLYTHTQVYEIQRKKSFEQKSRSSMSYPKRENVIHELTSGLFYVDRLRNQVWENRQSFHDFNGELCEDL